MSPSCSINDNNRVARLSETLYHIYKKEQYMSSIYSKMIKYLKTETLTYLIASNLLNSYNYHAISLYIFMYTVVINYIDILLIAIKTRGQNTEHNLIAVNEMLYFILLYMYMLHIIYDNIIYGGIIQLSVVIIIPTPKLELQHLI